MADRYPRQRTSVVLVTVDCLRADRVGYRGYARPLTPSLDSLAKESLVFSHAVVAGAPTYFSFPSIMASRHPLGLGREVLGLAPGEPTIATALRDAGYETAAFVAGNPYLSARYGYDQGFAQFADFLGTRSGGTQTTAIPASSGFSRLNRRLERFSNRTKITASAYNEAYFRYCQWRSARKAVSMDQLRRYPAANVVIDAACGWLQERVGQPVFLWIHLMDPHHPYYPPLDALQGLGIAHITPRRAQFLNSFWNRGDVSSRRLQRYKSQVMGLYDAGVYWVDQQVSRLVNFLKAESRWTDTIFAVTADHGEEFLEHGNRYHSPSALVEQIIRVPLLIHRPGLPAANVAGPFSLIHLAPTLLDAVGVKIPSSFKGHAFWNEILAGKSPGLPAIVECVESCNNQLSMAEGLGSRLLAVLDGEYKLVLRFREQIDDLYDLKRDPQEMRPLPRTVDTRHRARLLQRAHLHLQHSREYRDSDLALRAHLREIRQRIVLKSAPREASRNGSKIEIGEHG